MALNNRRETSETLTPKKKPLHELPIFKKINQSILQLENSLNIPLVKVQSGSSNVQSGPSNVQPQTALGPEVTKQRSPKKQLIFTETHQGQSIPVGKQHPTTGKVFLVRQSSEQKPLTTVGYRKTFSYMKYTENNFQTVTRINYFPKMRPNIPPPQPPNAKPKLFYSKSDTGFNFQTTMFDSQSGTEFTSQTNTNLNFNETSETWINPTQNNVQPQSNSQFKRKNIPNKNQNNTVLKIKSTTIPQPPIVQDSPKSHGSNKHLPKSRPIVPPPLPPRNNPELLKKFYSKSDSGFNSQTDKFDSQSDPSFTSQNNENTFKTGEKEKRGHHSTENVKKKNPDLIIIPVSLKNGKQNHSGVQDTKDSKCTIFGRINVKNKTVPQVEHLSSNLPASNLRKIKDTLNENKDGFVVMNPELLYDLLTPFENKGYKNESDESIPIRYAPSAPPLDSIY